MQAQDTDRTKFDDRDYSVTCFQCGETFEATRSDASFCSARCRVANSREPQKLKNALLELESMRIRVLEIANKYPANDDVFDLLNKLAGSVSQAIYVCEK